MYRALASISTADRYAGILQVRKADGSSRLSFTKRLRKWFPVILDRGLRSPLRFLHCICRCPPYLSVDRLTKSGELLPSITALTNMNRVAQASSIPSLVESEAKRTRTPTTLRSTTSGLGLSTMRTSASYLRMPLHARRRCVAIRPTTRVTCSSCPSRSS
jgi:hypothetical protein